MLGRQERRQLEFFVCGSLRDLVPDDHVLARVDRVLDLSWLRAEVTEFYCETHGRPGIDPEAAVRLMLAGFLVNAVAPQAIRLAPPLIIEAHELDTFVAALPELLAGLGPAGQSAP